MTDYLHCSQAYYICIRAMKIEKTYTGKICAVKLKAQQKYVVFIYKRAALPQPDAPAVDAGSNIAWPNMAEIWPQVVYGEAENHSFVN